MKKPSRKQKEMKKELTSRQTRSGDYRFYWGKKDITALWMDFFSGLTVEDEKRCVELFLRKMNKRN